jgi:hypothetical protein
MAGASLRPKRSALDLCYIANVSFTLDVRTVWNTRVMMMNGDARNEAEIAHALNWLANQHADVDDDEISSVVREVA